MELFLIVWFVLLIYFIGKNLAQWFQNENSPIVMKHARIVAMRRRTHHHNHNGHTHLSHTYHITFELETGERMELRVKRAQYNELEEGVSGILTWQGTRYLGFEERI